MSMPPSLSLSLSLSLSFFSFFFLLLCTVVYILLHIFCRSALSLWCSSKTSLHPARSILLLLKNQMTLRKQTYQCSLKGRLLVDLRKGGLNLKTQETLLSGPMMSLEILIPPLERGLCIAFFTRTL